ncbi:hypothetical protein [Streptomyces sp. NPDC059816]|uniref:hypothetical protein n=1 Tax=Streptomyces sp. NPDC059816 TaxID=3346960 RepID=UPI0036586313
MAKSVAAGGLTALLLGGCGLPGLSESSGSDAKPDASSSPTFVTKEQMPQSKRLGSDAKVPEHPEINHRDATQVAEAWGVMAYAYDTKYDAGPHDATLRALRYFTEKRAAAEREYRSAAGPGAEWNTWAEHQAWTKSTARLQVDADHPEDTAHQAFRRIAISCTVRGRDGWNGTGPRAHAYVTLQRSSGGDPWRISKIVTVPAAKVPEPSGSGSPD